MESNYATKRLNVLATKGDWNSFFQIYKENESTHNAAITDSGKTPLHVALSRTAPEDVVEKMLGIIVAKGFRAAYECLKMADKEGNTAFHLAALKGYASVCYRIKELSKNDESQPLVRLDDMTNVVTGENIIHVAVSKEHTDEVINLIKLFPELVDKLTNVDRELISMLFKLVMKGEWKSVIEIYRRLPAVHEFKITRSGDTALHIAVSAEQEEVVLALVNLIKSKGPNKAKEALKVVNERRNTPLHLAAALGNINMCKSIANVDSSLLSERNGDNETPVFLAALHGEKDVFLHFHGICKECVQIQGSSYWRRSDGATILHAAIDGDYFDLAFQIIHLYEDLVNSVDEKGRSPLHLLASKPWAFKSSTRHFGFAKLVYNCTFVEELSRAENAANDQEPLSAEHSGNNSAQKCPSNYKVCADVVSLVKKAGQVLLSCPATQSRTFTNDSTRDTEKQEDDRSKRHQLIPPNYICFFDLVKFFSKAFLVIVGLGSSDIEKIKRKKKNHTWAAQVMNEILRRTKMYENEFSGGSPQLHSPSIDDSTKTTQPYEIVDGGRVALVKASLDTTTSDIDTVAISSNQTKPGRETPILIAAKNGIKEMVEMILDRFPVAIQDQDAKKKNIVLLAVENRQPHVYEFLASRKGITKKDSTFLKVDDEGNSALHLAAKFGDYKPWRIPGAALQMQWEFKWYEYVKNSKPAHFFQYQQNTAGKTAKDLFTESHTNLVKDGGQWLTNTSQSCSVVAALIAAVAFATAATVPGGVNGENGRPVLEKQPAFNVFSIASLVALCFSVTAVVMFLSILTSRHQEKDFRRDLPSKLLVGLTTLFISIGAILVSFCAGHFFVLNDELRFAAYPVYVVTCLPVSFFAMAQFPLYFDLVKAFLKKVPERSYMVVGAVNPTSSSADTLPFGSTDESSQMVRSAHTKGKEIQEKLSQLLYKEFGGKTLIEEAVLREKAPWLVTVLLTAPCDTKPDQ